VSTRTGAHCNVFGIDHHRFCARTVEEKDLWLRAVSNIKVKLMFEAPDPSAEELEVFRGAVWERVEILAKSVASSDDGTNAAILTEVSNLPPSGPKGDDLDPDPIEDPAESVGSPAERDSTASPSLAGDVAAGPSTALPSPYKVARSVSSEDAVGTPGKSGVALPARIKASAWSPSPSEVAEESGSVSKVAMRSNSRPAGPGSHRAVTDQPGRTQAMEGLAEATTRSKDSTSPEKLGAAECELPLSRQPSGPAVDWAEKALGCLSTVSGATPRPTAPARDDGVAI